MSGTDRLSVALADRYRIARRLGEGGMATVYMAEDLKHKRNVALKVLKPELAAVLGAERFVQEIATTASLQHPHILPLFDSGQAEGFLYYVMPFIDGETLRDKLTRERQLGIDEAVRLTTDVADALDYAHRHGVIHRDIKPENILLHDGRPMVADFGIALAVSAAAGGRMTETGLSLGTPHYMSPEQATAEKEIGPRSDVYSLGSVLYEMLTGEPPHTGGSAQQVIMKIIADAARPVTELRRSVPPNVAEAVAIALEKLPADRFGSAREFGEALSNPAVIRRATSMTTATVAANASMWRRLAWPVALLAVAMVGAMGWLRPPPPGPVTRYRIAFATGQEPLDGNNPSFAIAPDGSFIVYDGRSPQGTALWIKRRDATIATPVPGTGAPSSGTTAPAVSPDGRWIARTVGSRLLKVAVGGGSALTLFDSASLFRAIAWTDVGTVIFRDRQGRLRQVPDSGGLTEIVWASPPGQNLLPSSPTALPDGRGVLFVRCGGQECAGRMLVALDVDSREERELIPDVMQAWYAKSGHIVYVLPGGGVYAAPFDLGSLTVTGPGIAVLDGVQATYGTAPDLAISESGMLFMITSALASEAGSLEAVWVDRSGNVTPVDSTWRFNVGANWGLAISPDGSRLAISTRGERTDVWIKELDRGPLSRLTTEAGSEDRPRWTPDGRSVTFISQRSQDRALYAQRADGTSPAEVILDLGQPLQEAVFSRDGSWLVARVGSGRNSSIWAKHLAGDTIPRRLMASGFADQALSLSPDGRWLAYQSNESGTDEVYVRPFPGVSDGKRLVSVGGGTQPMWSRDGSELFYLSGDQRMMAARIRASGGIQVLERVPLFNASQLGEVGSTHAFDPSADGKRFLTVRSAAASEGTAWILVENWFEELKARVPR